MGDSESMLLRHSFLQFFNLIRCKLKDPAALYAYKVIVVAAFLGAFIPCKFMAEAGSSSKSAV